MFAIYMSPRWGYVVHWLWALSRHKICPYIELIAQNQCRDMNLDLYRFYVQYLSPRWGYVVTLSYGRYEQRGQQDSRSNPTLG